jgi:hypothetical protein
MSKGSGEKSDDPERECQHNDWNRDRYSDQCGNRSQKNTTSSHCYLLEQSIDIGREVALFLVDLQG